MDTGTEMGWKKEPLPTAPPTVSLVPEVTSPRQLENQAPGFASLPCFSPGRLQPGDYGIRSAGRRRQGLCGWHCLVHYHASSLVKKCKWFISLHPLTDCAGNSNWRLAAHVTIAVALLTLCKRPTTLQVYIQQPALKLLLETRSSTAP